LGSRSVSRTTKKGASMTSLAGGASPACCGLVVAQAEELLAVPEALFDRAVAQVALEFVRGGGIAALLQPGVGTGEEAAAEPSTSCA